MRTDRVLLAIALIGALALAACSSAPAEKTATASSGNETAAKTVLIGFAAPLTGDNAVYGQSMKRAVDLAIKEANASDEVKKAGYTFVVEAGDDQGDPKQAVNVANLLVGKGVVGVVGHFNSGCSIPASKVYEGANLAMISVSTNPQLTAQGYKVVNRIVAKDTEQGTFAAKLVAEKLGYKKVAVVDDSTAYGIGLADEFAKQFKAAGGTVTTREKIQAGDKNFSALITKIKATGPQAIYYGGAHTEGALITKQAKDADLNVPVVGGDMLDTAEYIKIAGATSAEGDVCTALGVPLEQQPGGKQFTEAFKAAYNGEAPGPYDSYAYDSAKAFVKAVLSAGPDKVKVAEAVRTLDFDGVTGAFKFDSNGDTSNKAISAYKVVGGEWKLLQQ